jgi:hypothetical protein
MIHYFLLFTSIAISDAYAKKATFTLTRGKYANLIVTNKMDDSVAYKPGVDTRGRKVAPADLAGSPATKDYKLGDEVHINLEAYLNRIGPRIPSTPASGNKDFITPIIEGSQASFGSIEVHKDGKIWINDVPAFDEDQAKIETACRKKFPDL